MAINKDDIKVGMVFKDKWGKFFITEIVEESKKYKRIKIFALTPKVEILTITSLYILKNCKLVGKLDPDMIKILYGKI